MLTLEDRKENFIKKAKEVHGNNFNYEKVNYINSKTKVIIICPLHGEFKQTPNEHIKGSRCRQCSYLKQKEDKKIPTEKIIEKFKEFWGEKYNYSDFIYNGSNKESIIICDEHGDFSSTAYQHLIGLGCKLCKNDKRFKNIVKCKTCSKEFKQGRRRKYCSTECYFSFLENNPNKDLTHRQRQIKYTYGLTKDDYEKLVLKCNNSCEICNVSFMDNNITPNIDHCHKTNKVRGLLCTSCNKGIGIFKDNILLLNNAIEYLNKNS